MTDLNFFDEGSPFLKHPLLTPERTAAEIDFVIAQTRLSANARILDVGCGFGRHSVELAGRGFQVVGVDSSSAMIARARERAHETGVEVEFVQSAAQDYTNSQPFDGAICLFTTLGQIDEKGDNIELLPRVAEMLKPGGWFVVEVPQRKWVINHLKVTERIGNGERFADVKRHYDGFTHVLSENFRVVRPGEKINFLLQYRLYRFEDVRYLLSKAGLEVVHSFGGYDGRPLSDESPIILAVAKK